jgi:ElaA protein
VKIAMQWRAFEALGVDGLYELLALRAEIFVVEQKSPWLDVDGRDRDAEHLLAHAEGGQLVGCVRLLPPPGPNGAARIGRLACAPMARGKGLGRAMMRAALDRVAERWPMATAGLSAQTPMVEFYRSLGFRAVGEPYDEAGVEHVEMVALAPGQDDR